MDIRENRLLHGVSESELREEEVRGLLDLDKYDGGEIQLARSNVSLSS